MKKVILVLTAIALLVGFSVVLKTMYDGRNQPSTHPTVVTSFYPLYYFANEIGKDRITLKNLTPAGSEPHDYEPTTDDLVTLQTAAIVVINGAGMEPWIEKVTADLTKNNVRLLVASEGLTQTVEEDGYSVADPHVWLDPVLAQEIVKKITKELTTLSPGDRAYFEENAKKLNEELQNLHTEYEKTLATCKKRDIFTSHDAFGYLARRYNMNQVALTGFSPEEEPSAQKLAETVKIAKEKRALYIFFETLVSPRLANTIAKELGARTLIFDPIEGVTEANAQKGQNYVTIQKQNLLNLKLALSCM